MYYDTEQPLPNDPARIAFQIGASATDVQLILEHYFELSSSLDNPVEKWIHKRCEQEITAYNKRSESARKSANARWKNANAMRTHTDRNAEARVLDANQEPITNITSSLCSEVIDAHVVETPPRIKNAQPKKPEAITKPEGVTDGTWQDFVALRKGLKAPLTATALKLIEAEATKAGVTVEHALQTCCLRGWRGFKAEWVHGHAQVQKNAPHAVLGRPNRQEALEARNRAIGEDWAREMLCRQTFNGG